MSLAIAAPYMEHRSRCLAPLPACARVSGISAFPFRYPVCFGDLTFPNDIIRREHSPPGIVCAAWTS